MSTPQPDTLESLRTAYTLGQIDATTYRTVRRALVAAIGQGVRPPSPLAPAIQSSPHVQRLSEGDDATVRPITEVISAPQRRAAGIETSGSAPTGGAAESAVADDARTTGVFSSHSRSRDAARDESARNDGPLSAARSTATDNKKPLLLGATAVIVLVVVAVALLVRGSPEREEHATQMREATRSGPQVPETPAAIERLVTRSEWTVEDLENARQAVRALKPAAAVADVPSTLAGLRGAVQERINLEAELARSGHRDAAFDEHLVALARELDLSTDALTGTGNPPTASTDFTDSPSVAAVSSGDLPVPTPNVPQGDADVDSKSLQSTTIADSNDSATVAGPAAAGAAPAPSEPIAPKIVHSTSAMTNASTDRAGPGGATVAKEISRSAVGGAGSGGNRIPSKKIEQVSAVDNTPEEAPRTEHEPAVSAALPEQVNAARQTASGEAPDAQRTPLTDNAKGVADNVPPTLSEGVSKLPAARTAAKGSCESVALPSVSKGLTSRACVDQVDDAPGPTMSVIALGGGFEMGGNNPDEMPVHHVVLSRPFAIGKFEISVKQYRAFVADTGVTLRDQPVNSDNAPVVNVTWDEAVQYCRWLSRKTGAIYRLPSEAEWEWAARAGEKTRWPGSDSDINAAAIHGSVLGKKSKPRPANMGPAPKPFGLVNMLGNVREWVQDSWQPGYVGAPVDGQPVNGSDTKVVRGGSFRSDREDLRLGARKKLDSSSYDDETGFRIVRDLALR